MYNINLNEGEIVTIYKDPRSDMSEIEGTAKLIEKLEYGDSFYLDYELLYKPYYGKSSLSIQPDPFQLKLNKLYEFIDLYIKQNDNPDIISFVKDLKKLCNRKDNSYNRMYEYINKCRKFFEDHPTHAIHNILQVENKYVIRYIQQTKIKDWRPTLFRLERWKVEFINDKDPFHIPWTTTRWVRTLLKISPLESTKRPEICTYTTYNGTTVILDDEL